MPEAITDTSPLVYLYRIETLAWLPQLFSAIWLPTAVTLELREGRKRGYDVPDPAHYNWFHVADPQAMPSEWFTLDLGPGERAAMALALEKPDRVVILDDSLARRIAQSAGLQVWGTLRLLLEAKSRGLTTSVKPLVDRLAEAGLWMSDDIRRRVLTLAGE
jgi:predicted nucleic acid-binding protein